MAATPNQPDRPRGLGRTHRLEPEESSARRRLKKPSKRRFKIAGSVAIATLALLAVITGSLGMLPSATIGGKVHLYEPGHGSAPDLPGKGLAQPLRAIPPAALLLRHSPPP